MTDQTSDEVPPVLPFASFLAAHRQGATADDVSIALRDLVAAVEEHGKKGELILRVKIEPASSDAHVVSAAIEVQLRAPAAPSPASIFYADRDHNLTRDDPYSKRLPLAGPTGAVPNAQEA